MREAGAFDVPAPLVRDSFSDRSHQAGTDKDQELVYPKKTQRNTCRADGKDPHWRAIRDDRNRVVVAINFNNDLGDSWQLADDPRYPEKFSALGIRQGLNYVVYAMSH